MYIYTYYRNPVGKTERRDRTTRQSRSRDAIKRGRQPWCCAIWGERQKQQNTISQSTDTIICMKRDIQSKLEKRRTPAGMKLCNVVLVQRRQSRPTCMQMRRRTVMNLNRRRTLQKETYITKRDMHYMKRHTPLKTDVHLKKGLAPYKETLSNDACLFMTRTL